MGEIPAKWLEESAANAAKRMKKDPMYGNVPEKKPEKVAESLKWREYRSGNVPHEVPFLCIVEKTGGRRTLEIYVHDRAKQRYWLNLLSGQLDRPLKASHYAVLPEEFFDNFPVTWFDWK